MAGVSTLVHLPVVEPVNTPSNAAGSTGTAKAPTATGELCNLCSSPVELFSLSEISCCRKLHAGFAWASFARDLIARESVMHACASARQARVCIACICVHAVTSRQSLRSRLTNAPSHMCVL